MTDRAEAEILEILAAEADRADRDGGWSFLLLQRMAQCAQRMRDLRAPNKAPHRHFDFLCAAVEGAISAFHEGAREGDNGLLHIDDLEAARRAIWAAYELCDATECTPYTDEFGAHYRVPVEQWEALAAAMRGDVASPPTRAVGDRGLTA